MFSVISKIFQTNHQNRCLNTEVVSAIGPVTGLLEPTVRVVTPTIGLSTIIIGGVSLVTGPPILVNKMMSLSNL